MDPLAVVASCLGVVSAIATITKAITELVSEVRDAKDELGRVSDELLSVKASLENIADIVHKSAISAPLESRVKTTVVGCRATVGDIGATVEKCLTRRRGTRFVGWMLVKGDVNRLRASLMSSRMDVGIALTLINSETSQGVKSDTGQMAPQVNEILHRVRHLDGLSAQDGVTNRQVLEAIQQLVHQLEMSNSSATPAPGEDEDPWVDIVAG